MYGTSIVPRKQVNQGSNVSYCHSALLLFDCDLVTCFIRSKAAAANYSLVVNQMTPIKESLPPQSFTGVSKFENLDTSTAIARALDSDFCLDPFYSLDPGNKGSNVSVIQCKPGKPPGVGHVQKEQGR